jgi:hypothetical protein
MNPTREVGRRRAGSQSCCRFRPLSMKAENVNMQSMIGVGKILTSRVRCADGMQVRSKAILPSTMRIKPILRGVNRGAEKRGACVTLFAHL